MITFYVYRDGKTAQVDAIDPAGSTPDSGVDVWADVREPTPEDAEVLAERSSGFTRCRSRTRCSRSHFPKVESYGSYLYVILHGIDFKQAEHAFVTLDVDFFLGRNYLVTVHDGGRRSIAEVSELCDRNERSVREGPVALMHRIVDHMVDHYRPEVDELEDWLDEIEGRVLSQNAAGADQRDSRRQA